jgi:8-oxo-dGTP pyrophosphatase MutT (NUDIX family)
LGHATGMDYYDIFKGRTEEGESYVETAIRECEEESGLAFTEGQLKFFGVLKYIKKKDLGLFLTKLDMVDMDSLTCTTYLDSGKPEMDYYTVFEFDEMLTKTGKNLARILIENREEIEAY